MWALFAFFSEKESLEIPLLGDILLNGAESTSLGNWKCSKCHEAWSIVRLT
jgi:hypothetical protein